MKRSALLLFGQFPHSNFIFMVVHSHFHGSLTFEIFEKKNCFIGKLVKWVFILQEYEFDIIHSANRVNWDANTLSWNPSSYKEDTTRAWWHDDVIRRKMRLCD
jgi:hypothetical protein